MGSSPLGKPKQTFRKATRKRVRLLYERRISLFSIFVAVPGMLVSGIFIWMQAWSLESKLALIFAELFVWWLLAMALQEQTTRPLQTLANVIAALREEDYSFRARGTATDDALGELSLEVNALADLLADQRIRAIEATALLRRVVEEIEVPLFTFDPHQILRLVNSAGERLLQEPSVRLLGRTAKEIGLDKCLSVESGTLVPLHFHDPNARWLVRGHELNNSLTPIKSIAGSLNAQVSKTVPDANARQDFQRGLTIIGTRADSLNRFLQAYRQLAQMPPPVFRQTALAPIVERVAGLETRLRVQVVPGPDVQLMLDPDQFEQMLINLARNAVEAVLEPRHTENGAQEATNVVSPRWDPQVVLHWDVTGKELVLTVDDNGPGFLNPSNAFVPFYTTKPAGSGIGLVLCRQIAEAHGGSIELVNQSDKKGCRARVVLPRTQPGP